MSDQEQQQQRQQQQQTDQQNQPANTTTEGTVTIDVATNDDPQQVGERTASVFNDKMSKYSRGLLERHIRYDPLLIIFAISLLVAGIIAYTTKNSVMSLVFSTIFAILIAVGTYFEGARRNPYPVIVVLFVLGTYMFYRYFKSLNFMPSGLIALLTTIMFARHCYLIYLRRQQEA